MRVLVETVQVDGHVLRLRTLAPAGRSRDNLAPTAVLVHGIGMSHRSFTRLQRALSHTYRTIAVDLPGFGGTPAPGRVIEMSELASLVVRAVREAGVQECIGIGQSMGAQVVTEMAQRFPEFTTSVVLVSPVVDDRRRTLLQQAWSLALNNRHETPWMNVVLFADYCRSIRQYMHALPVMMRYPMLGAVATLRVPVLVLRGTADPIAPQAWVRRLAGAATEGALIELPGGHHVQQRQSGAAAAIIDEFVRVQDLAGLR